MKTKTHFAFRVDIWDDTGNSIAEHVAAQLTDGSGVPQSATEAPLGRGFLSRAWSADSSQSRDVQIGHLKNDCFHPKNNGCLGRLSKAQGSRPGNDFTSWFPLIVEALTRLRSSVDAVSLRDNCHENLFQI